jgi:heptosyltransferase-1
LIPSPRFAVLVHGSSCPEKLWPDENWIATGRALAQRGISCLLPWGDPAEAERAHRLAASIDGAFVPAQRQSLTDWTAVLAAATAVIGVDTGLTHLAAACGAPTTAIFTATRAAICGVDCEGPHRNLGDEGQRVTFEEVIASVEHLLAEAAQAFKRRA